MHYTKPVLSIQEKIKLLQSRGLIIKDEERAKQYLSHIGYFRLTGYLKYYQDPETNNFYKGITFDHILDLYVFDRKLRLLVLDYIEKIEVSLKAMINDYMSIQYGFFWYVDETKYMISDPKSQEIFDKLMKIIGQKKEKSSAMFVKAFKEKYTSDQYLPSQMFFEECTLGEISTIFLLLNENDSKIIAGFYGTYVLDLKRWIQVLVNIRNISAHHARLWNRRYTAKPRIKDVTLKDIYKTEISENGWREVIPHFFNVCLIINYLLTTVSPHHDFIEKLSSLFDEFPNIPKTSMGFDDNRKENFT